ncbi:hypothetical protein LZ31DRAFT_219991 [Colletotrichum somersetense]|nr:hypothetical protein LZ31DRAFT_219991 [Colletotrichum somersetense]
MVTGFPSAAAAAASAPFLFRIRPFPPGCLSLPLFPRETDTSLLRYPVSASSGPSSLLIDCSLCLLLIVCLVSRLALPPSGNKPLPYCTRTNHYFAPLKSDHPPCRHRTQPSKPAEAPKEPVASTGPFCQTLAQLSTPFAPVCLLACPSPHFDEIDESIARPPVLSIPRRRNEPPPVAPSHI